MNTETREAKAGEQEFGGAFDLAITLIAQGMGIAPELMKRDESPAGKARRAAFAAAVDMAEDGCSGITLNQALLAGADHGPSIDDDIESALSSLENRGIVDSSVKVLNDHLAELLAIKRRRHGEGL